MGRRFLGCGLRASRIAVVDAKPGDTGCLWPNGIGIESPAPIQGSAAASVWSAECFRTDILHSVGTLKDSWSLRIKYNDTHRSYRSLVVYGIVLSWALGLVCVAQEGCAIITSHITKFETEYFPPVAYCAGYPIKGGKAHSSPSLKAGGACCA